MEAEGRLVGLTKKEVLKEIEMWADERAKKEGVGDDKDSS